MAIRKAIILYSVFCILCSAEGAITQFDTENADRNLTSQVTCLTDTPDASNATLCIGYLAFGDGVKNLDGTGGLFELTITVGGQTIQPDPQVMYFSTAARSAVWTSPFLVPANNEVILKVKSPNAADTDVDVTAYLYEFSGATEITSIKASTDNLPADPADQSLIESAITSAHGTTDAAIVGLNNLSAAQVNAEVDTALADYDPPTKAEMDTGFAGLNDPSSSEIADAVHDEVVEGTVTLRQAIRLFLSVLTGKSSGGGTANIKFRDIGDTKDRLDVTVDSRGNRTAINTRDGN